MAFAFASSVFAVPTADFTQDHGDSISGELYLHFRLEIIDCFDQTNASDLKQIVCIFIGRGKTFHDTEYKTQISLDIVVSCIHVALLNLFKQSLFFRLLQ